MTITSDDLQDLKQFISAELYQRTESMREEIVADIDERFERVEARFEQIDARFEEMDEKLDEVLDAVGGSLNEVEKTIKNHEVRIGRLEKRTA